MRPALLGLLLERLRERGAAATFARGALASFAVHGLGMGIAFVAQVYLARLLGPADFGAFLLAATWANVLCLVASLGLDGAALRFVAAHAAREEHGKVASFTWSSLLLVLGSGTLVAGLTALALDASGLHARLGAPLAGALAATLALIPARSVLTQAAACVQGARNVVASKALPMVVRPAAFLAAVGIASVVAPGRLGAASATWINVAVTFGVMVWALRLAVRPVEGSFGDSSLELPVLREWLGAALPLLAISGCQVLLAQVDTLLVGAFLGAPSAGLYGAASQVALLVTFGITAVNALLAPVIADLHARGRRDDLQRVLTFSSRAVLLYSVPVMLALAIWGRDVLGVFDPTFRKGWLVLVILGLGQLAIALSGSVGFLLTMTGHQRDATRIIAATTVLDIVLNLALIPLLGLPGAALATALAVTLRSRVLSRAVRTRLGLSPSAFPRRPAPDAQRAG